MGASPSSSALRAEDSRASLSVMPRTPAILSVKALAPDRNSSANVPSPPPKRAYIPEMVKYSKNVLNYYSKSTKARNTSALCVHSHPCLTVQSVFLRRKLRKQQPGREKFRA